MYSWTLTYRSDYRCTRGILEWIIKEIMYIIVSGELDAKQGYESANGSQYT
jgi:hypothetical protein